jgi:hypothetical protein
MNSAVHIGHCCAFHGCKYGDEDCPVVSGEELQAYPCEYCIGSGYENPHDDKRIGVYIHFKGNIYELIEVGKDSDTLEEVAVYRSPKGDVWTRPWKEFDGIHPEHNVKRFERL